MRDPNRMQAAECSRQPPSFMCHSYGEHRLQIAIYDLSSADVHKMHNGSMYPRAVAIAVGQMHVQKKSHDELIFAFRTHTRVPMPMCSLWWWCCKYFLLNVPLHLVWRREFGKNYEKWMRNGIAPSISIEMCRRRRATTHLSSFFSPSSSLSGLLLLLRWLFAWVGLFPVFELIHFIEVHTRMRHTSTLKLIKHKIAFYANTAVAHCRRNATDCQRCTRICKLMVYAIFRWLSSRIFF